VSALRRHGSVNANKKVWNCRGCRIGGDVIDLVQHLDGGTFDQNIATLAGPPTNSKSNGKHHSAEARPIVVAEYLYHDENGVVLFGVDRIHYQNADGTFVMKDGKYQKSFIQKRPDPAHPGKWLKGVKDKDGNRLVRNVPYHLPGMIEAAANDHPIVIVEGEAKADLLATWNICATCNAGGAKHWGPEHSAFFKDADVIILPDNDSAGFEHTDVVGRSLTGIAKRIRRLALPNLSPKGDILNWAQVGHTREQLDAEIAKAPDWTPSATTDATPEQPEQSEVPHLDVFDAGDDIELPPPRGWLLGNQFCRGFLSSLVAPGAAVRLRCGLRNCSHSPPLAA